MPALPRPLHEVLSTAILISFASKPQTEEEGQALFAAGGGGVGGASLSVGASMAGSYGGSLDELGGNGGAAVAATGISYGETAELVSRVMDRAEVLRRKVRGALRRTYRDHTGGLERLNFTLCVAPVIESVLADRERELYDKQQAALSAAVTAAGVVRGAPAGPGSSFTDDDEATAAAAAVATAAAASGNSDDDEEPVAQVWALRAALHLWLWFDQECARYREEVRAAGGLLVIGTSLNESPRIELQLRGRAGRQGDPGETKMLLDCVDPLMVMFGMDKVSAMLTQLGNQLQTGPDYLEGGPVDYFVNYVVRWQESMFQNMRLETKKYDAVMEEYRHNLYTLRRLVLCGGDMQRAQIVYVLIQRYVDELVGRYLDPGQAPARWLRESVRQDSLPGYPETPPGQPPAMVSPLQAVIFCLRALVNPRGRTTKTLVDFSEVTEAAAANPTVRKMLELFGGVKAGSRDAADAGADTDTDTPYLPVYMQVQELEILAPEQRRNLAEYIAGTGPLEWPVPAAVEIRGNFKLQLQLRTHRKLFGYGAVRSVGTTKLEASSSPVADQLELSAARGLIQRPQLHGPFAEKVAVLRNYLGEVLIGCYEARRLAARLTFTASPSLGFTDIDAEQQVCAFEQQTMLLWIDALWSCFLEDTARLRNAVNIRSTNGSNPVEEFRIEANAAFLALLDNYRDAVLDKLLVPDFSIYAPLESEIADTDLVGRGGLVTGQAPTEEPPGAAAAAAAPAANAGTLVSGNSSGGGGNGSREGGDMHDNMYDNRIGLTVSGEVLDKPNGNGGQEGTGAAAAATAAAAAAVTADFRRSSSSRTSTGSGGVPVGSSLEGSG
ncbi:hypothetical protein Vretimale_11907 [Volvox reticuliferus]|uniref:SecA family profile domain-containing protein n=1 Tax=Volvox reticuliferus TaxID=1737510 RepID=A0A8J4GHG9_9CHLO|nr:hypothetical protein Vretimale_11907 [Volvox reticuliferus]